MLRKDFLGQSEGMGEQENEKGGVEGGSANVSEIYRRLVMAEGSRQGKEKCIETYENNNILRYTSKSTNPSFDSPHISQNSSLEFTE